MSDLSDRVVLFNKHAYHDASWCDEVVSIMRPNVLGNPFPITRSRGRREVIDLFEAHLDDALSRDTPQRREIERLAKLVADGSNVALVCCCTPQPCHGDHIKRRVVDIAEQFLSAATPKSAHPTHRAQG